MADWEAQRRIIGEKIETLRASLRETADRRAALAVNLELGTATLGSLEAVERELADDQVQLDRLTASLDEIDRREAAEAKAALEDERRANEKRAGKVEAALSRSGAKAAAAIAELAACCSDVQDSQRELTQLRRALDRDVRCNVISDSIIVALAAFLPMYHNRGGLPYQRADVGEAAMKRLREGTISP